MVICLDPGHGALGSGCSHNGIDEAIYVLAMAHRVEHELMLRGIGSCLTRVGQEHVSFTERAAIARRHHAKGVVVIHVNADVPPTHGPMAFDLGINVRAIDAAAAFVRAIDRPGEYVDRGIIRPMLHQAWVAGVGSWREHAYNCMRCHDEPVILVECGYASNADEATWLMSEDGQSALASAIAGAARVMVG